VAERLFRKLTVLAAISRSRRAMCERPEHGSITVILIATPRRDRTALASASSYTPG